MGSGGSDAERRQRLAVARQVLADAGIDVSGGSEGPFSPFSPFSRSPETAREEDETPRFPVGVLPDPVAPFLTAGAAGLDVPIEMIAVPFLGFAAAAIGNQLRIEIKQGWVHAPILWLPVIADPGKGKTPAINFARKPFDVLQEEAIDRFRAARRVWEEETAATDEKGSRRKEKRPRPRQEAIYVVDATMEALAPLVEASPGVTVMRDELVGWVRSFDAYRSAGDRQQWLSLWADSPLKVDRRSSDPIYVAHPCVSVVGGIQPDLLPELAAPGNRNDGFLDRFLPVMPAPHIPCFTESTVDPRYVERVTTLCRLLRPHPPRQPVVVTITPEARQVYAEWHDQNRELMERARGLASGCYAKYPVHLARLALVLHALRYPLDPARPVDAQTMSDAIVLIEYFRLHLSRVLPRFGAVGAVVAPGLPARLLRMLEKSSGEWVSRTFLWVAGKNSATAEAIEEAMGQLVAQGFAEQRVVPTRGRPRQEWRVSKTAQSTDLPLCQKGEKGEKGGTNG